MKHAMKGTGFGVALVLLLGSGPAFGKKPAEPATCSGDFGTAVQFLDTPTEAAHQAKKEGKLVFVLHLSGHFEDPRFT
jgi:hypothetical protein